SPVSWMAGEISTTTTSAEANSSPIFWVAIETLSPWSTLNSCVNCWAKSEVSWGAWLIYTRIIYSRYHLVDIRYRVVKNYTMFGLFPHTPPFHLVGLNPT